MSPKKKTVMQSFHCRVLIEAINIGSVELYPLLNNIKWISFDEYVMKRVIAKELKVT